MTIFYEQRPRYGVRDQVRYIDAPMGLIPLSVTAEDVTKLEDVFVTWSGEHTEEVSEVYLLKIEEQYEDACKDEDAHYYADEN